MFLYQTLKIAKTYFTTYCKGTKIGDLFTYHSLEPFLPLILLSKILHYSLRIKSVTYVGFIYSFKFSFLVINKFKKQ